MKQQSKITYNAIRVLPSSSAHSCVTVSSSPKNTNYFLNTNYFPHTKFEFMMLTGKTLLAKTIAYGKCVLATKHPNSGLNITWELPVFTMINSFSILMMLLQWKRKCLVFCYIHNYCSFILMSYFYFFRILQLMAVFVLMILPVPRGKF